MTQYKPGRNIETVRETNIALAIKFIHKEKVCSRSELANFTGLKQATITKIINDLINWGLVEETGIIEGKMGRRSIGLKLNGDRYRIIAIRLNRDYITVALFDIAGVLISKQEKIIDHLTGAKAAFDIMVRLISNILDEHGRESVLGIGVAIPGPFFAQEGKIAMMTGFPGWDQVDIKNDLEESFKLPTFLEQDANCGALAEWWYGSHGEYANMLFVAADKGVGAGIIVDGQIFRGAHGFAGEIGHMSIDYNGEKCECGNRGCLELYCSTAALENRYKKELIKYPNRLGSSSAASEIMEAVKNGDIFSREVFAQVVGFLGIGLVNVVNIVNPSTIIISDKLSNAGEYLVEIVTAKMKEHLLSDVFDNLKVCLSSFNEDPILFGASALVFHNLCLQPSLWFKPDKDETDN